jgi:hypothetical protein
LKRTAIVVLALLGLYCVPSDSRVNATPIPFCPGDGIYVYVLGAEGATCDFLFMPDAVYGEIHTHCDWGGFEIGSMFPVTQDGHCGRFDKDGNELPLPAPPKWNTGHEDNGPVSPPTS